AFFLFTAFAAGALFLSMPRLCLIFRHPASPARMPAPTKAGVDERRDISLPCKKHKSKKREKGDVRIMSKIFSRLKPGLRPLPPGMTLRNKDVLLATWFGSGLLRPASGTIGT